MTVEQALREPLVWMTLLFALWTVVMFCGFWFFKRRR